GFDGSGGNGVHADLPLSEIVGQIAHCALKSGFGNAHDVVVRHNLFRSVVSHGQDAAAIFHQRNRGAGDSDQRVDADVVGDTESFARRVDEFSLQFVGRSERHAVYEGMQLSVTLLQLAE